MLRQSVGPRQEASGKPELRLGWLQSYLSGCRRIIEQPAVAYATLIDKVKQASTTHVPSARLTVHAFVDGFVHVVGPRFFSHLLIIIMAAAIAIVGGITTSRMTQAATLNLWQFEPFAARPLTDAKDFIGKPSLPFTIRPKRAREGIVTYEVKAGDTVSSIAERFEITSETVVTANKLDDADSVTAGEKLVILPISGILHVVGDGDTVEALANKYQVEAQVIAESEYNNLAEPYTLFVGQKILVPGGKMPEVKRPVPVARADRPLDGSSAAASTPQAPAASQPVASSPAPPPASTGPVRGGGRFVWPTVGQITQGYSGYHPALDIGAPIGTPIYASEGGVVIYEQTGYDGGYGWNLKIDHGDGYVTHYAHVSKFLVSMGQGVSRGQPIALVGVTGLATGPHLHFEIYQNGVRVNPSRFLP